MPSSSSSKKTLVEPSSSKKASTDVTPLRISSRVRKEKFNVKELFSIAKDKDSSDDEFQKIASKRKATTTPVAVKSQLDKDSKPQIVRVESAKASTSKLFSPKPGTSKTPLSAKFTTSKKVESTPSSSKDDRLSKLTTPKTKVNKISKDEDKYDPIVVEGIKIEPIFNEDNIDTVLENPSSLGLDIVVTKLSDSDQREHESKKSKNVVTIAKVTGSSAASKPIKVVPMKPSDKIPDITEKSHDKSLEYKTSGVVITPKIDKTSNKISNVDKKTKVVISRPTSSTSTPKSATSKSSEINQKDKVKSLGSDVVVVTQTIEKGTISTKVIEKKREIIKQPDQKTNKSKVTIVEVDLDKTKSNSSSIITDKAREIQRQKAIKRSIADVMSDFKSNGHKPFRMNTVKSAEADSSSHETELKKAKVIESIFGEDSDVQVEEEEEEIKKPAYDFDRYFVTSESIIEHNESLDSDGSNEDSETYLSHFFEKDNLNNNKKTKFADSSVGKCDEYTIYDLMYEVNCEYPSWNLHVMQDTASFLICQATRGAHGLPTMSKMIELESDFSSAKVYINQIFHREFCGAYNTYDSIRQLINNVQQL